MVPLIQDKETCAYVILTLVVIPLLSLYYDLGRF